MSTQDRSPNKTPPPRSLRRICAFLGYTFARLAPFRTPAKLAITTSSEQHMPIVELQQVRKAYDTKIAVEDLSFSIEPGSMFGLLGPNGSGKTSSIRMMIGITVPDSGNVQPLRRAASTARTSIASAISLRSAASTRR